MDRQRQRKLDARKRRMESLASSSTSMNLQDSSKKKTAKGKERKNGTDN